VNFFGYSSMGFDRLPSTLMALILGKRRYAGRITRLNRRSFQSERPNDDHVQNVNAN
jgi:hypothetical protein